MCREKNRSANELLAIAESNRGLASSHRKPDITGLVREQQIAEECKSSRDLHLLVKKLEHGWPYSWYSGPWSVYVQLETIVLAWLSGCLASMKIWWSALLSLLWETGVKDPSKWLPVSETIILLLPPSLMLQRWIPVLFCKSQKAEKDGCWSTGNLAFDPGMAHEICRNQKKPPCSGQVSTLFRVQCSRPSGSSFMLSGFGSCAVANSYGEDAALCLFPQYFRQLIESLLMTCPRWPS